MSKLAKEISIVALIAMLGIGFIAWKYLSRKQLNSDSAMEAEVTMAAEAPPQANQPVALPAAPVKVAGGSAVNAFEGCSNNSERNEFILVGFNEFEAVYKGAKKLSADLNPHRSCSKVGDSLEIVMFGGAGGMPARVGSGKITSLTTAGDIQLEITSREPGRLGRLPRICRHYCDGIIDSLKSPLVPKSARMVLVDVSDYVPDKEWFGPVTHIKTTQNMSREIAKIDPNEVLVVTTTQPVSWAFKVSIVMRRLRQAGFKKIYWYYPGVATLKGKPIQPPDVEGVKVLDHMNFKSVPDVDLVYVGDADRAAPFEKSIIVIPPKTLGFVWLTPDDWDSDKHVNDWNFVKAGMASRTNAYAVYGDSVNDWRAYWALKALKKQGYTKLYWFRGGSDAFSQFPLNR